VKLNLWPFFVKQQRIVGSYGRNRRDLDATLAAGAEGWLTPVKDRVVPLDETPAAFAALRDRAVLGKILVVPRPE
jgi:NADPH2:quinone reductase